MSQVLMRKPTEDDLVRFRECLRADMFHVEQNPDEWLAAPGEFWTFYDEEGNRVWCRIERCLRVSIQHDINVPRKKLAPLIYKGFFWLQGMARNSGFTEVIFESRAERLIHFLKKLFGFEPIEETYRVRT